MKFLIPILIGFAAVMIILFIQIKRFGKDETRQQLYNHKATYVLYCFLRLSVVVIMAREILNRNYESAFLCGVTLVLFLLPTFLEKKLRIEMPTALEFLVVLFVYAAEIMGEVGSFYTKVPGWDTWLHTVNGFLCAAAGYAIVSLMNRSERTSLNLSPKYMALMAFCFSMTIGVLWEFGEFFADQMFLVDCQKDTIVQTIGSIAINPQGLQKPVILQNIVKTTVEMADGSSKVINGGYLDVGLIDTMKDLFVNFVGALSFSLLGLCKNSIAGKFIPKVKD